MSYHELTAGYPWLTKRVARALEAKPALPSRHPLAYVLAALTPYAGRLGAAAPLIAVAIVGILAAVAIPAYQDYTRRAAIAQVLLESRPAMASLEAHFTKHNRVPARLADVGVADKLPSGATLALDSDSMRVTATTSQGSLLLVPRLLDGRIRWICEPGEGLRPQHLPVSCRA